MLGLTGLNPNQITCSALPPSPSSESRDADKARTEQRQGCRLGHLGREFGDDYLAIANPKIGYQDLVRARVKRAAPAAEAERSASSAATTSAIPATATASTVTATAAAAEPAVAAEQANAASEIWKRGTAAGTAWIAPTSIEEPATATATVNRDVTSFATGTIAAALPTNAAASAATVLASETASSGLEYAGATTAPGDDKRSILGADHEASPTAAAAKARSPRAPDDNLQSLARGQPEVATYFGTQTSKIFAVPALSANG
jgi:hypothetical protein